VARESQNVTADGLKEYVARFLSTLRETADQFLAPDHRSRLLHLSLLPAKITCYVSTQFGVGFEYSSTAETTRNTEIESVLGSARIEDLIFRAPASLRERGPFLAVAHSDVTIRGATFQDGFPFRLYDSTSNVTVENLRLLSGEWSRFVQYAEVYGERGQSHWSADQAISRAKNEVLAAVVEIKRAEERGVSITEYIARFKEKTVLLLGSYDAPGKKRLATLGQALKQLGYEPLLVAEVPDHPLQSLAQKVGALGSVARFVVVDDSEASGHIAELQICQQNDWVTLILRSGGKGSSWMTAAGEAYSTVILEAAYDPPPALEALRPATAWAEKRLAELSSRLARTYPWRR